ncbi:Hypothetical protein I595_3350 [Croceitalea dokdonensis DOKDO 023]|uniref:Uncharacterized protein n=1 Tax=Croceitalea dokdonensis DOKDO 023 TaxID=1300341 RepID=A0A0P7ART9_9FLAO|nr:hypothetical protein [Croceitalea dokdonensis]KPM30529.1 Hypothetical protein I595_3350 [Croceitalea dokdonensis DOKDO 023]
MRRRSFTQLSVLASMGLLVPMHACKENKNPTDTAEPETSSFEALSAELLAEWCDAMLATQIDKPEDPTLHGALFCDACNRIHGRCMDAVYPFLYMADTTGEQKYVDAAINVMEWSKNVSKPDGSWTVVPNPKTWAGITVFGAIALGEALHHHGHILPEEIKVEWTERLKKAAEFVHKNFNIDYSHTNYPITAVYGLHLWGELFDNEAYKAHARQLADEFPSRLTQPNHIIFGENKPATEPSEKGLLPVDLGYNVEETLNGIALYAVAVKDDELLALVEKSMESHLEFMLPDGAWDNSWGTRQNKWSYWGSRTTDGCQPAFSLMADRNEAFGTAAYLSTELLQRCTVDGLLAGGLHYEKHGVLPCLHHTFAHAKSLAFVLDNSEQLPEITKSKPVPRSLEYGIKHFEDLAVWLVSTGPWRGTVSANDVVFKKPLSQAATGGSLAVLWHEKVGPLFTASMAEYLLVEPYNQQPQPNGEDFALTPRMEVFKKDQWYTNLYDLKADVLASDAPGKSVVSVKTQLTNKEQKKLADAQFYLTYSFEKETMKISTMSTSWNEEMALVSLVLPLISPNHEKVTQVSEEQIEIEKEGGTVVVSANAPMSIKKTKRNRIFNMVPGMEAIPITIDFTGAIEKVVCTISVR